MKKLTLLIASILVFSCSNDTNCQSEKDAINLKYDSHVQYVKDNPGIDGIDYRQISLLNQERDLKLSKTCN